MRRKSKTKVTGSPSSTKKRKPGKSPDWLDKEKYPHVAKAHEYAEKVLNGEIDACKFVKLACKRHLDDLEKSKLASYQYYFDSAAGEEICVFSESFPHVEGPLEGELIVLELWQCFINVVLFGWMCKSNGTRRFRMSYEEIPRKNGKSLIVATRLLYMLTLDGEKGARVYCGATTEKQANEVFEPARLMAMYTPEFTDYYNLHVGVERISIKNTRSYCERMIGKPGDGGNPHYAAIDEKHEHKTDAQRQTMIRGMVARRQPMLNEITSAGKNTSYPCYAQRKHAEAVLEGRIQADRLFCIIYTIDEEDDWTDYKNWIKANPNYGVSVTEDALQLAYEAAMTMPSEQADACCKHLNMWIGASKGWLNMVEWGKAKTALTLDDFIGEKCWIAFDLASKIDLTSVVILFERYGKYYAFTKNYMPRKTVDRPENEHYRNYEMLGYLTVTEGARTDFRRVEADLKKLNGLYDIQAIGYDPREATMLVNNIMDWFFGPVIEITQSAANMNEPMEELEAMVAAMELLTEINTLFDWCASNLVRKNIENKYYMPGKDNKENKIDPMVALIMAIKLMMSEEEFTPSATVV